jgi:glycosyltransferase involved in cell wall biosynthesis
MINAVFVMEQHLGHQSFFQNMRRFVDQSPHIQATWARITYRRPGSWIEKIPLLPGYLSGTLVGRMQVREALQSGEYDIALFNTQVPAVLGSSLLNRRPYVLCTDITPLQYDQMGLNYGHRPDQLRVISRFKQQINTSVFQNAARVLPWSHWTAESVIGDYGVLEQRVEVVPPGVDVDVWRPGHDSPGREQQCKPLRILFVGGDFYRKGGSMLVEACRELPAGSVELILVTKSDVPQESWIHTHRDLVPNSAELVRLYQSCDIFVLPSNGEAFGIAAVEASSVGLPVIATRIGGLVDIVTDQETGFLIPPGDKKALVQHLFQLLDDCQLRREMGQAGRTKAEKMFNAKKNASRVIEILCENAARSS